jgi:hypothetical protein
MSFYCHLLAQLLLVSYQQPNRDLSGSHNGQILHERRSNEPAWLPVDSPMRCREVPTKFPLTGVLRGTRPAR